MDRREEAERPGLEVAVNQPGPIPLDASLTCSGGEVLALVGPSGSGKSTILRSVAGLYRPLRGRVTCGGKTWLDTAARIDHPPQRRSVGMVFQDFALLPHLSVAENVAIALGHVAKPDRARRVRELLDRIHLAGLESRLPAALSGGQQQRVALARALARDPEVMLLDEPFSAVDQVTRRKLRLEMAELTRSLNIPIVLVTHDLDEASMLGHRMCVLHGGKTLQTGTPEAITRRPRDATVARLIDVRNLFEGAVAGLDESADAIHLDWAGVNLEAAYAPGFPSGSKLCWCISPEDILLHRRIRPSRGERENPVRGRVTEMILVGGIMNVIVALDAPPNVKLNMDLPPHVARRNGLGVGERIGMSILKRSIHLMPWQSLVKGDETR